jgi:hypothetical protein
VQPPIFEALFALKSVLGKTQTSDATLGRFSTAFVKNDKKKKYRYVLAIVIIIWRRCGCYNTVLIVFYF